MSHKSFYPSVMRKIAALCSASLLCLCLAACADGVSTGGSSGSSSQASSGSEPMVAKQSDIKSVDYTKASYDDLKDGGTLTLPISELTEQQNVWHQSATTYSRVLWYFYNPVLLQYDDSFEPVYNPDYLTDVKAENIDGKTVVTYTINEKASFNDGAPIDWKAFEATWKINNGESKDYAPNATDGYADIESVKPGVNDKQVVVTYKRNYVWYYDLFGSIAHPKLLDPEFYAKGYLNQLQSDLGAGPYKVESFDRNQGRVSFVRNEKWWGKPGKLDRITYVQMESTAQINALKNGEIDGLDSLNGIGTKDRYDAVKDIPGMKIYTATATGNGVFMLNAKSPILSDPMVRKAIMEGRNREQLAKIAFNGMNYEAPLSGSFLLFMNQKGYRDNFSMVLKYDPEDAKKLLDEAGWKMGDDGIRVKDGQCLELTFPLFGDNQTAKAQYLAYQQMYKELGVDILIKEYPSKEFANVWQQRQFDILSMAFNAGGPCGVAYFGQIYATDSGLNLSGTGTPELDQKIAELKEIPDRDAQIAAANELEVEAFKQYGIMPGSVGPDRTIFKEGLANVGSMAFSGVFPECIGWLK